MKTRMIASVIGLMTLVGTQSFASGKIACWSLYSKKGSKPILSATIVRDDELADIVINQEGQPSTFDTNGLQTSAKGSEITTNRSPYKGAQEFTLANGIRLILPTNLSSESLANTTFKAGNTNDSRQNGVLDVAGPRYSSVQGGDGYTRMHCISR
ncbi:MAG TPA: hypothetical protein VF412_05890 [Bdellovibrio sp.]|uniref:hypothetical protein n=1 Tax=Bdellovibrio sp. TaxID=28201 RepID=UPI002F13D62E